MPETKLQLLEIYPAYQGEGSLVGQPVTFVRFGGCTVGCSWCDTKYSWKPGGTEYTPIELLNLVYTLGVSNAVFTGGEPFEQPHNALNVLIQELDPFFLSHVTWETSGVAGFPTALHKTKVPTLLSVAPKLPSAHAAYPFPDLNPLFALVLSSPSLSLQLKFIVDPNDEEYFENDMKFIENVLWPTSSIGELTVILTPTTKYDRDPNIVRTQIAQDLEMLHTWITKHRWNTWKPTLRILPQLHAMVYGSKRGI